MATAVVEVAENETVNETDIVETVTQPAPRRQQNKREYVILSGDDRGDEWWKLEHNGWGFNAQDAKEDAVSKLAPDEREGMFVAIPVRSWKPSKRAIETSTRTRWS